MPFDDCFFAFVCETFSFEILSRIGDLLRPFYTWGTACRHIFEKFSHATRIDSKGGVISRNCDSLSITHGSRGHGCATKNLTVFFLSFGFRNIPDVQSPQ